jgi:hypothetical protein
MPSFLVPLHEFNDCHAPDSGQFCSDFTIPKFQTAGARVTTGFAGQSEGFELRAQGASQNGYIRDADFPGARISATRGELFWGEVPPGQRGRGLGRSLAMDALRLLQANGTTTVNISPTSAGGRGLVAALIRDGVLTLLRTSPTGKAEYKIATSLHEFNPCHAPAGSSGGGQFCATHDAFVPMPPRRPLPLTRRKGNSADLFGHYLYMNPAERREWNTLRRAADKAISRQFQLESDALYAAGGPWEPPPPTPDIEALRKEQAIHYGKMFDIEAQAARRAITTIATELGFPPERLKIIDDQNPREFVVGGQRWNEGGHYRPTDNTIQINIRNLSGIALVKMVSHEIAHAKFEVWQSAMSAESERLNQWKPEGVEQTRSGMFIRADGSVYPQFLAAFKREFPAHAAVMGTYGSYYVKEPHRVYAQMIEDDGFTDYSKAYWTDAQAASSSGRHWQYKSFTGVQRTGTPFERAIDETLAEVNSWRVARRMGWIAGEERTPTKPWRKFSAQINQFYRAHGQT